MSTVNSQTSRTKEMMSKRRIVYNAIQRIKIKNKLKCSKTDLKTY